MTRKRHYHPLAALRFLRKTVLLCLTRDDSLHQLTEAWGLSGK